MSRYDGVGEFREKYIPYNEIIKMADLKDDDIIIDMGAGDGFYSLLFSNYIKNGTIYSVERNPEAIELINKKTGGIKNIKIINEDICGLKIRGFNKIFFSTVFHDIKCRDYVIDFIKNNSKKPLTAILIEFKKNSIRGPPADIKIDHDELKNIFESNGFTLKYHRDFLYNYVDIYVLN